MGIIIEVILSIANPFVLGIITLGVVYGLIFGMIPGLGPAIAVALLIPFSISLPAIPAIAMMGAAYISAVYGGSISAILINTPGEATSTATTFDGYPLTRQGKADIALGASLISSFIGGIISVLTLVLLANPLADIALRFGSAEFFSLSVFGLVIIAAVSRGALLKGGIAVVIGLLISMIGYSPSVATPRFSFGITGLETGVDLIPVLVGLFAVSEAIILIRKGGTIADDEEVESENENEITNIMPGIKAGLKRPSAILRSSAIGVGFGIIPAMGAAIANFVAYQHMESISDEKDEFGTGVIEGVIGPEASNNAVTAAALIPTLILSIPGNATTAVLLGALMFHEINVGPLLLSEQPEFAYAFFLSLFVANIIMFIVAYYLSARAIKVTKIDVEIIAPAILLISMIGVYTLNLAVFDVLIAISVGYLAVVLRRYSYSPINIVFGVVLGPIIETNYQRALNISDGSHMIFITRPVSGVVLLVSVVIILHYLLDETRVNSISR